MKFILSNLNLNKSWRFTNLILALWLLATNSIASSSDDQLSFWLGIKPYGSEEKLKAQTRRSFYELGRYFNALDHWREDIYRPINEQENWRAFRKDIQKHDTASFLELVRGYKANSLNSTRIYFGGDWNSKQANPSFSFATHNVPDKAVDQKLGAMQGQLKLSKAGINLENTQTDFSAEIFLDTILFTEFLQSIESINRLFEYDKLNQLSLINGAQGEMLPNFSEIETLINSQFHYALPNIMATLEKVSNLEKLAEQQTMPNGHSVTRILDTREVDLKGLKQHFPDTYRDFKTLLKSISYQSEIIVNRNKRLGAFSYNADSKRFKADFALAGGALVLQTLDGELTDQVLYPTQIKQLDYQIRNSLKIEMFGLDIEISGIEIDAHYSVQDSTLKALQQKKIHMQMNRLPSVEVKGALLYILPSWLIDLLIPGTLETLIADAFGDLIEGKNGQGIRVSIAFNEQDGKHKVVVSASAEIPHELLQAILKIEKKEQTDKPRLYDTLRHSLRKDFSAFASKFNDSKIDLLIEPYRH